MVTTLRPKCRTCGAKIFKPRSPFNRWGGRTPEHCPQCGEKLVNDQKQQLEKYESFLCGLSFLPFIIALIIGIITIAIVL